MSGTVKRQFEELAAAQKKGEVSTMSSGEALKLLQEVFKNTEGAMARLAKTTDIRFSNLTDNFDNLKVALGTGMNEGLKVALDAVNAALPMLEGRFTELGELIGKVISDGVEGNFDIIVAAATYAGDVFVSTFKEVLIKGLRLSVTEYISKAVTDHMASMGSGLMTEEELNLKRFLARESIVSVIGQGKSASEMTSSISAATQGSRQGLMDAISQRDRERSMKAQADHERALKDNAAATKELIRRGLKLDRETIERLKQEMFSR
jgi:hypothetical protein